MIKKILLHGLEGSSQGFKATHIGGLVEDLIVPDFEGDLYRRMDQLAEVTRGDDRYIVVGSSLGGLMGALWTCQNPERVKKLILLAPALHRPDFEPMLDLRLASPPTLLFHGTKDRVVPLEPTWQRARQVFLNLQVHTVEDDHRLKATTQLLDWKRLLDPEV